MFEAIGKARALPLWPNCVAMPEVALHGPCLFLWFCIQAPSATTILGRYTTHKGRTSNCSDRKYKQLQVPKRWLLCMQVTDFERGERDLVLRGGCGHGTNSSCKAQHVDAKGGNAKTTIVPCLNTFSHGQDSLYQAKQPHDRIPINRSLTMIRASDMPLSP